MIAQINAALPTATPAMPQFLALLPPAGAAGGRGALVAASTTTPLTPSAVLSVASPEATFTVTFVASKSSFTIELGAILTVPTFANCTVAKLPAGVANLAPETITVPVAAAPPFTRIGRLLVVT